MVVYLFEVLPICCIVDRKYFCVHAGLSPDLSTIGKGFLTEDQIQKIERFTEIPQKGLLCDLLWSDPVEEDRREWAFNTTRSCSYFFTRSHAYEFLKKNNLQMLIRGHEVQLRGYKYQEVKKSEKKCILTVFSAPNYCEKYNNLGSVVRISPDLISMDTYRYIQHPPTVGNVSIIEWSLSQISRNVSKLFLVMMKAKLSLPDK